MIGILITGLIFLIMAIIIMAVPLKDLFDVAEDHEKYYQAGYLSVMILIFGANQALWFREDKDHETTSRIDNIDKRNQ